MAAEPFTVTTRTLDDRGTALGAAGPFTVVIDRPAAAGGGGLGFNGGELLHLAVAGCVSNDLFREAARRGIALTAVDVTVWGGFAGEPAVSTGIDYTVDIRADAARSTAPTDPSALEALLAYVDTIAEIPNSLRAGTPVTRH